MSERIIDAVITADDAFITAKMDADDYSMAGSLDYEEGFTGDLDTKIDVSDYNLLPNKPKINNHELIGNKKGGQLELINTDDLVTEQMIDTILYGGL